MPIIKSAKKRVRVARKATIRNVKTKRSLRAAVKAIFNSKPTASAVQKAQSEVDKATKKGVMHKNKAARKKRQLAAAAKRAGVKPAAKVKKATSPKKTVAKKPTSKKAPAKKN